MFIAYQEQQFVKYLMKVQEPTLKLPYMECNNKKHQGQSLNLVCIQPGCKDSGLLCTLCREHHKQHRVIPLKHVIAQLKKQTINQIQSDVYCDKLQSLQNLKQSMLYELKCCVEQIADQFRQLQQDIIDTYNKIKVQIIEQIQLSMELNDLVKSTLYGTNDPTAYLSNFKKLSKWIHEKDKELVFSLNLESFVLPYQLKHNHLSSQIHNISKYIKKDVVQFKSNNFQHQILVSLPNIPQEKFKYRFSSTFKAPTVILNPERTLARQGSTSPSRFALIQEGMGVKQRKIIFKIKNLVNWVGLGVCLKDKIISTNYAFKYEVLGHGSYLLSNNGYTWSHSSSEDNIHPCLFVFKQGSILEVTLSANELTFKLQQNNASLKLKICYKEEEWPNVCFCANLCSENDSVEILDE